MLLTLLITSALDAASVYLPPTADAIGGKTGWICSVLIAGPMPSEGGEIGMLRYAVFFAAIALC